MRDKGLPYSPSFGDRVSDLVKRRGQHRPPCRNLSELAEEFGIKRRALMGMISSAARDNKQPPKPVFFKNTRQYGVVNYYNHAEFRAWWAARK